MPKSKKPRHAYKRKVGTNFWNVREENLDIIRENFARLELKSLVNLEKGECIIHYTLQTYGLAVVYLYKR